jgi:two-component system cell cycle sensor histidine kinase/response regulator CckA
MPRMSGRALADQLRPGRPAMKLLFASGYTDDAIVHHGVLDAGAAPSEAIHPRHPRA